MITTRRVRINNGVAEFGATNVSSYSKANRWSTIHYLQIPFIAIQSATYEYSKNGTVSSIAKKFPTYNFWFNGSYVSDATILGKTIKNGQILFGDSDKTKDRPHLFYKDGRFDIGHVDSLDGVGFSICVGPLLLDNGKNVTMESISKGKIPDDIALYLQPRTLVGINKDTQLVTVAFVDGRGSNDYGLTADDCARVLQALGCQKGINLDGGGSSTIYATEPNVRTLLGMNANPHICDTRSGIAERAVSHAIGLQLNTDKLTQDSLPSTLKIQGTGRAIVNGIEIDEAVVINGHVYIGLRSAGNALKGKIRWENKIAYLDTDTSK